VKIAIIGAGVAGLTCGTLFAERGWNTTILADEIGTASTAAAAIWYPYDTGPTNRTISWALVTYERLTNLLSDADSGVSMIQMRMYSRSGDLEIPDWAIPLGAKWSSSEIPTAFVSGFTLDVPLMDTAVYLDYLVRRFNRAGGVLDLCKHVFDLEGLDSAFDVIVNCTGIGARTLVSDSDLEPHRGQIVCVPKLNLASAIVSDDAPLMYAIPRRSDCVFGGTNDISDDRAVDDDATARIIDECSNVLSIEKPHPICVKVGLRPFRRTGVRLESARLTDERPVIHNYGHGGSGFTLSWGCAEEVFRLAIETFLRVTSARSHETN